MPRRPKPGTAAGVGDRALLRVERSDETEGPAYRGHIIKVFDKTKSRILGVFREPARRRRTDESRSTRSPPTAS